MSFHRIVSLEVDDGFLKETRLEFAAHLNCVIGSRGSGKTTLLEFIRFALNQPPTERLPASLKKLLDKNLKPGRVRLVVEDAQGKRFLIDRFAHQPPKVFDEVSGRALVGGWDSLFRADVLTQAEIATIAERPDEQLALLDGFAREKLLEIETSRQTLEHELEELAKRVIADSNEARGLLEARTQLHLNAKRLEELKPAPSELAEEKSRAIAAQVRRRTEATELQQAEKRLLHSRGELSRAAESSTGSLANLISSESLSGENASLLKPISDSLNALVGHVEASLQDLSTHFGSQLEAVRTAAGKLEERHLVQDAAADEVLRQDGEARERLELEEQQAILRQKHEALVALTASRQKKIRDRQDLVDRLATVIDRRTTVRQDQCARLNSELEHEFGVRLRVGPGEDATSYSEMLEQIFRGSGKHGQKAIIKKLLSIEPRTLVKIVLAGKKEALARDSGLEEDLATWVLTRLEEHESLWDLQATTNNDTVQIQFNVSGIWKPTQDLSTGQKCSAILPILMLQNARPLVADEPEGHLDQKTLVDRLVRQIREMKGARQLILATHNPNIVTLGDAGETSVIVLSGDGSKAVASQGSVDAMRQEIEDLLEGGREAFKKRGELYAR